METKNTQDLITEFSQLCLGLQLQSDSTTFLLFKHMVHILQIMFKYYGPIHKINPESYYKNFPPQSQAN
jgi:hypothetical protein